MHDAEVNPEGEGCHLTLLLVIFSYLKVNLSKTPPWSPQMYVNFLYRCAKLDFLIVGNTLFLRRKHLICKKIL
jgi:hypothetical protein